MAFWDKYPFTNFHELNLDWILRKVGLVDQAKLEAEAAQAAAEASQAAAADSQAAAAASQAAAEDALDQAEDLVGNLSANIASNVSRWLQENVNPAGSAVTVDRSLLVANSAADSLAVGAALLGILDYNAMNLIAYLRKKDETWQGITYTWDPTGLRCRISGTASETSYTDIVNTPASFPLGIKPGGTYYVRYTSPAGIQFMVYPYIDQTLGENILVTTGNGSFTVPENASGILFRLRVPHGYTVNEIVYPQVMNQNIIGDADAMLMKTMAYTGSETGLDLFGTNNPYSYCGWVLPSWFTQRFIGSDGSAQAILKFGRDENSAAVLTVQRNPLMGSVMVKTTENNEIAAALRMNRYDNNVGIFGDSIMWGTQGDSNERANPTIPQIIGTDLGVQVSNLAVSSMGWIHAGSNGRNAYQQLVESDISQFDTIILCFGVNDGFYPIGAWNSTDENTVMGQVNKCYAYITDNAPDASVIMIAPFNGSNVGSYPLYWYGSNLGGGAYSRGSLVDALRTFCQYHWIPFIEQNPGIITPDNIQRALPDGVHPSQMYHIKIGTWLAGQLSKYI